MVYSHCTIRARMKRRITKQPHAKPPGKDKIRKRKSRIPCEAPNLQYMQDNIVI